ncbi:hypothetical protein AMK59_863 [Oryctes borbonicus]|uniref:Uncharacterized protein n=1 Tax=Oryctes borbonicus TaxID=1629725 RepID=A0A0T6BHF8_9SCAR|nr:hypothetical protein AMK59_863 [Oryctes borbonicus]
MRYFYLYYKSIGDAVLDTTYFIRMEDILAYYCSLELEIVHSLSKQRENKKHNLSVIKRLCKILGIYLHHKLEYIIHVLLKVKYNMRSPACQTVMRRVYCHFLMTTPSEPLSHEVFCRYYLAFERYKQIAKQEEQQKLGEFVFRKFRKTEDYLKTNPVTKGVLSPTWKTVPDALPLVIDWLATAINQYFVYLKNQEIGRILSDYDMNLSDGDFVNGFHNYSMRETSNNDSDSDIQQVPKEGVIVVEDFDDMQMTYIEAPKNRKTIDLSARRRKTTNKATCSSSSSDISIITDEVNIYESSILSSSDKEQNKCDDELEIIDVSTHCQVMETAQDASENSVPSSRATLSVVNSKSNEDINNSHNSSDQVSEIPSTVSPSVIPDSKQTEVVLNIPEETNIDSEIAQKNSEITSENINLPNTSLNSDAHEIENQQPDSIILPYELSLATEPFQKSQEESEKTSLSKESETVEHEEESWSTNSNTSILASNQTIPLENETLSEFCALSISASSLVQSPNFLSQTPTSKPQHAVDNGEITTSYIGSVSTDMASKYTQDTIHGEKSISISALSANLPDDIFIEATLPASAISSGDNESIPQSTCIYPDTNNQYSRGDDIISHAMTALFESYSETESNDAANTSEMDIKETIVYAPSENILDSDGQINTDRDDYSNTEVYSEAGQFLMEYNVGNSCPTTSTKSSRKKSKSRKQKKKLFEKEYSSKSSEREKYTEPQKVLYTSGVIDNYSKTEMNGDKDIDGVLSGPVSTLLIVIPQQAEETLEIDSFSSGGYNDATSSDKKSVQGKPSVHFSDSVETRYIPSSCNCSEDEEQNYIIHDGIKCYVGDHKIIWNTEIKFLLKKLTTVADENMSVTEKPITGNHNTKKTCIRQKIDYRTNATMKGESFQNDININTNNIPTNVHTHVFNEVGTATGSYIEDPIYNNNNETAIPPDIPQSNSNSPKLFLNVEQIQPCRTPIPTTLSNMEAAAIAGTLNYHPFVNEDIVLEKECNAAMEETRILPSNSECSFQTFPNQFLHYPSNVPNTFYIHNIETGIIVDSSNRCLFTNAEINPENRNEISIETSIRQDNAVNSPGHFLFANPEMDSKKTNDMTVDVTIPQDPNFEFSNSPKLYNSEQLQSYLVPIDENYVVADNVGNCRILLSNNSNYYDLKLNIDMSANHSVAERDIPLQENTVANMVTCSSKDNLITNEINYPVEAWSDDGTFFLFMPPGYSSGYSTYDHNLRKESECDIAPSEQEPYLPHDAVIPAQRSVTPEYYKDTQLQPTVVTHNTHSNVQNLNKINEMSERKSEIKTINKEVRKRSDMESKKMPFKKRRLITEHDVSYSTKTTYIPEPSVKTAAERKVYPSNFS